MEYLSSYKPKKVNQWNNNYISPGPVASIGDVLQQERFKQSCPDLPMRVLFNDFELQDRGQNVQDGRHESYMNGGLGPIVEESNPYTDPTEPRIDGWKLQELRPSNLASETRVAARPQDTWKSQTAQTYLARTTGQMFMPLPGGYPNSGIPRGPLPVRNALVDTGDGPRRVNSNPIFNDDGSMPEPKVAAGKTQPAPGAKCGNISTAPVKPLPSFNATQPMNTDLQNLDPLIGM